jgi:hypothetical protein
MADQAGFPQMLWQSIRPDILSAWRDGLILVNLLLIIALIQLSFFGLGLLHVDPDLLGILANLHKWATVLVFALFLYTVMVRAVVVAFNATKKREY